MMPFMIAFGVIVAYHIKKWQTGVEPAGVSSWDNYGRVGTLTLAFSPVFPLVAGTIALEAAIGMIWIAAIAITPFAIGVLLVLLSDGYDERHMRILNLPRGERPRVTVMGQDLEVVEMDNGIEYNGEYAQGESNGG